MANSARNPFSFPVGVAPGFDPTHPASKIKRDGFRNILSCVAVGSNMVDTIRGQPGTQTNSPGAITTSPIGPCVELRSTATVGFTGLATGFNSMKGTCAGIFFPKAGAGAFAVVGQLTAGGGDNFAISAGSGSGGAFGGYNLYAFGGAPAFSVTANVGYEPMFIVVTGDETLSNAAIVNLKSGQIRVLSRSPSSPGGGISQGLLASGPFMDISHMMFSTAVLTTASLAQWASDPWSFWYPNK
jgi:hypothetical protein